ncbi:TRAP transporter large permease subunit [Acetomicrobium sp.]|uniref:TRAP transporter large permease subunit n=1 Tax=Acetomicrobium sp. TaxID=1872099 RepID=UPI002FC91604
MGYILEFLLRTEAAAVAVFYSLLIGVFVNRTIKLKDIPSILLRSGVTAGAIMFVLGTVSAFGYVITREGIPQQLTGRRYFSCA